MNAYEVHISRGVCVGVCVCVPGVCFGVGSAVLAPNDKSATWSQIGPQPGFRSLPSFGKEWD